MASHEAAGRAVQMGYTKVAVMVDGIKGWKAKGKPVDPMSKAVAGPQQKAPAAK